MHICQAKKIVEDLPQQIRTDIGKEEATKIKEQLEAAGGVVELK